MLHYSDSQKNFVWEEISKGKLYLSLYLPAISLVYIIVLFRYPEQVLKSLAHLLKTWLRLWPGLTSKLEELAPVMTQYSYRAKLIANYSPFNSIQTPSLLYYTQLMLFIQWVYYLQLPLLFRMLIGSLSFSLTLSLFLFLHVSLW